MKLTITSFALFFTAILAYVIAGVAFLLHIFGILDATNDSILTVPYAIVTGWILNGIGVMVSIVGFFIQEKRKWACTIPLVLNATPPIIVLGIMAIGFVLMG